MSFYEARKYNELIREARMILLTPSMGVLSVAASPRTEYQIFMDHPGALVSDNPPTMIPMPDIQGRFTDEGRVTTLFNCRVYVDATLPDDVVELRTPRETRVIYL